MASGDAARADSTGERERFLRVGEAQLRAVALGSGPHTDLGAEHGAERIGDGLDGLLLIRMQASCGSPPPGSRRCLPSITGPGFQHTNRPLARYRVTGESAPVGMVRGEQQRTSVALGEIAPLEQRQNLVGEVEKAQ